MPSAQHSVVIHRPLDEVFTFFTEPTNELRWRRTVKTIAPEGPPGVGRKVHQVVKGPGGLSVPADVEVTGYEPMSRYAFRGISGPVRPAGEFRFSADGADTTVSFALSVELSGVKQVLMSRSVQRAMDGEVSALDRAKAVLEGA